MSYFSQKLLSLARRVNLVMPRKWRLAFNSWVYFMLEIEPEIRWLEKIGPCSGIAIDVGANEGIYTYELARLYSRVVAFEPNVNVASSLETAALANVKIVYKGLSCASGNTTFYLPSVKGVQLAGWGSLNKNNCPDSTELESRIIEIETLDSFEFKSVGFIKIDVEGHEIEVLKGAAKTIQRDRPHLLVEVKDSNLHEVRNLLFKWGYQEADLFELVGSKGSGENHIFIPAV